MDTTMDNYKKIPITLLIDDMTPYVNLIYYYIKQVEYNNRENVYFTIGPYDEPLNPSIPINLLWKFITIVNQHSIKGKISLVPYPAGLGRIDQAITGIEAKDLEKFLHAIRTFIAPLFDISPEMNTHTLALCLDNEQLDTISEEAWSHGRTEEEFYRYLCFGLEILKNTGFNATGFTSPIDFGINDEATYVSAIRRSLYDVYGHTTSWYFLHQTDGKPANLHPYTQKGQLTCVHIPATLPDLAMELLNMPYSASTIEAFADRYITRDGSHGMIVEQLKAGSHLVSLLFHWSALYSNGHYTGLKLLNEVVERIENTLSDQLIWQTPSEIADLVRTRNAMK